MNREIDLHTHSTASDGSLEPARLVEEARRIGLRALAISDHDTFAGYEEAARCVQPGDGIRLVCAIELSARKPSTFPRPSGSLHLLGYFFGGLPDGGFRRWLDQLQQARCDRNRRLAERLAALGVAVPLEEAESLGRSITGRAHFAILMVRKGYVRSHEEAFARYLGEQGLAYVPREEPEAGECVRRICEAGGVCSLAHPGRLWMAADEERQLVRELASHGLQAIEAYHSDHESGDVERYLRLAEDYGMHVTAGSDFHGEVRPDIRLGSGRGGNLAAGLDLLDRLSEAARG